MTSLYQGFSQTLTSFTAAIGGIHALISLLSAELFLLLVRNRELVVMLKRESQRTPTERVEIARGLCRSIMLELCIFAPASVFLILVIVRPILFVSPIAFAFKSEPANLSASGLLGVIGYQFPFAMVRKVVTRMALETLQKFASIAIDPE